MIQQSPVFFKDYELGFNNALFYGFEISNCYALLVFFSFFELWI